MNTRNTYGSITVEVWVASRLVHGFFCHSWDEASAIAHRAIRKPGRRAVIRIHGEIQEIRERSYPPCDEDPGEDLSDEFPRGEFPIAGVNYFPGGYC
jgi:hypothetical protein